MPGTTTPTRRRRPQSRHFFNMRGDAAFADWLQQLSRQTRRAQTDLVEYGLYLVSREAGHPVGEPPPRTARG